MANRNENYRPLPVDFTILEILPEQGMVAGVHWKGRRAKDVRQEVIDRMASSNDEGAREAAALINMGFIQGRLRSMHVAGYIANFAAAGGDKQIWARTVTGSEFLTTKETVLGG